MAIQWKRLEKVSLPHGAVGHAADLALPAYPEEKNHSAKFKFHVSRITRGHSPSRHLILLDGGPGGKGASYLNAAMIILEKIPGDVILYIPAHRGTGKSGKLSQSHAETIQNRPGAVPIESLTVQNAAWDVIALAEAIQSSPEWKPDHRLCLFGGSYGAYWATRVINLAPELFDSALLSSSFVAQHFWDPLRDRDILHSCSESSFCSKQLNDNVPAIRNTVSFLTDPNLNQCTRLMLDFVPADAIPIPPDSNLTRINAMRIAAMMHVMMNDGAYSTMAAVALLNQMYKCPSLEQFTNSLYIAMNMRGVGLDDVIKSHFLLNVFGTGGINTIANKFIIGHEIFDMSNNPPVPGACASGTPYGLINQMACLSFWAYKKYWTENFTKYKPKVSSLRLAPISTTHTRLLFFHGALDAVTPLPALERFYHDCKAPSKRLVVHRGFGHTSAFETSCGSSLLAELLDNTSSKWTDFCMMKENYSGADWSFSNYREVPILQEFWLKNPEKYKRLPTKPSSISSKLNKSVFAAQPDWAHRQSMNMAFFISILLALIAIPAIILLAVFVWRRRKNATKSLAAEESHNTTA